MGMRRQLGGGIARRRVAVAALIATASLALGVGAPAALGATTVVGFDDQAAGTAIAEQYAALGVHVGRSPFPDQTGGLTVVARAQASSSPNAAALAYDAGTDFSSSWIAFDKQQRQVSFSACRTGAAANPNVNAVAYDANGNVVANVQSVPCTADGALVPVTVTADHISFLNVYATGGSAAPGPGWALDDLTFETDPPPQAPAPLPPPPPPPATPDFSLNVLTGPTTPQVVAVAPGGTAVVQLVVGRNETSSGPVALSVGGLPAGVTASFDDPAPGGSNPRLITMTLSAAATAAPGGQRLAITGTPQSAAVGPSPRSTSLDMIVQGHLAAYVKGIEITQGVQTIGQPDFTDYQGVHLVHGKPTVVRVYVGFVGTVAPGVRPQIGLSLSGNDNQGRFLPGLVLLPDWSPPSSALTLNQLGIGEDERVSPSQAFVFTLPDTWTTKPSIALRAQVLAPADPSPFNRPDAAGATVCVEVSCGAAPTRDLNAIRFQDPPPVQAINAVEQDLTTFDAQGRPTGADKPVDAPSAFARLLQISPVPFSFLDAAGNASPIPRYRAVRTAPPTAIWEDADAFDAQIGRPGHSTFGAFNRRSAAGVTFGRRTSVGTADPSGNGAADRPLTVIAHEVLHTFGILHADQTVAAGGCGGDDGSFADPRGRLGSVGIDIRFLSGGHVGAPPYRMIPDTAKTPGYDLMSYCAALGNGDPDSWISATNWDLLLANATPKAAAAGTRRATTRAATPAAATAATLHVRAATGPDAPAILRVDRTGGPEPGASPTPYALVGLDAAGRALSTVPMTGSEVTAERGGSRSYEVLDGALPAAGVASVQVVLGAAVVATRAASAHAPAATLAAPSVGSGATPVTVRWRATDADHDPVTAELDYSADGGRTFHDISGVGAGQASARLPVSLLAPSRHARLRLRLSDGFNATTVLSRAFVVPPRRPTATILTPVARQRVAAGSSTYLSGGAVDGAGKAVPGARLRWFAGSKALGTGTKLSALLPAGTRGVRLVATDAAGRSASASAPVTLAATTPFFLKLTAPKTVSKRARSVTLTIVASQPAQLRVGSARFAVGRTARTVRVTVRPGSGALSLRLRLTANGRSLAQPLLIARG